MPILRLLAELGLNKSGFDAGLDNASKQVNKFGGDLKKSIAGAFGVAALTRWANEAMQAAKEITQLSNGLNVTTDEAQLLMAESERTGKSMSELAGNAEKLEASLSRLRGGDVLFSRDQVAQLEKAREILDSFKTGVGQEMANIIEDPMLLAKRMLFPILGTDTGGPQQTELTKEQSNFLEKDAAKKRKAKDDEEKRLQVLERVAEITKQTVDIEEKTRQSKLTQEERINELLQERAEIQRQLTLGLGQEGDAILKLERAKIDSELNQIAQKRDGKSDNKGFTIGESSLGRIGAFTGAASLAAMPPGAREQIAALNEIKMILGIKGAVIKNVKR